MAGADLFQIQNYNLYLDSDGQQIPVVSHVNLSIREGEIVGLIGESGSGKTVLWKSILGLLDGQKWQPEGSVMLRGTGFDWKDRKAISLLRGKDISVILQDPISAFDQVFTIEHHFWETARAHTDWTRPETREKAITLLHRMYIREPEKVLAMYPFQCSGGMLQRVMIAIALLLEPSLLIADEPTTAVDVTVQRQIISMLQELNREKHTSILYISHDLKIVEKLVNRVFVMYAGNLIESFPVSHLNEAQVFHPYTKQLLKSRPSFSKEKLFAIARALAAKSEVILLDEPLSSLDVSVQAQILNLLKDLQKEYALTYILVSHDLEVVYNLSDHIAVMYAGNIVEEITDMVRFFELRHPYTKLLLNDDRCQMPTL